MAAKVTTIPATLAEKLQVDGPSCDDRYCVLSKVLTKEVCSNSIVQIWNFYEDISNGAVNYSDPKTWQGVSYPSNGEFKNFGAGFVLGEIREVLASKVFSTLFSTMELHSSKEGFRLVPMSPNTSKSFLVPGSDFIKREDRTFYFRSLAVLSGNIRCILSTSKEDNLQVQTEVSLSHGDVLLFRSDVSVEEEYSNCEGAFSTCYDVPAVMYCSMKPAIGLPKKLVNRKVDAYKSRQTGTFQIDEEIWTEPSSLSCRCYFRTNPPLLSRRQAELYGLLPYNSDDWEDELNRATIRGICLTDGNYDALPQSVERECKATSVQLTCTDQNVLQGQDKYLGGMASPNGKYIFGVPGTSKRVLRISTETGAMDCIGPSYNGKFKWLRGVEIPASVMNRPDYPDGCCIALPCNSLSFLKVNPVESAKAPVYTFGHDVLEDGCKGVNGWYYHGGNLASNGWLYCIPANATRVVKLNPATDEALMIGPAFEGGQKWYGGIIGTDGCVYGIPHNAQRVLKIDPNTDEVTLLEGTNRPLPLGNWKWHGGLAAGNKIIGFPNNSDEVLVIDCQKQIVYTIGGPDVLKSGRHRIPQDGRYKYLGGALTQDGRYAYLFPCDAERVLRIDCQKDELILVGPCLLDGENKFQNGFFGKDGCLYGIPQRAVGVLRVTPGGKEDGSDDHVDIIPCGDDMMGVKDKFEGGVLGPLDGGIYCIPLKAKTCVKIMPASL